MTFIIINRLVRSPKGTAIRTVRDDEIAAAAIGVDPTQHRVMAFVTGAFFAGVAGARLCDLDGYLNANSFSFLRSIEIVVMCTLGGMSSLWGAAIAAVVLTAIPEILDNAQNILDLFSGKLNKPGHPEILKNTHPFCSGKIDRAGALAVGESAGALRGFAFGDCDREFEIEIAIWPVGGQGTVRDYLWRYWKSPTCRCSLRG